MMKCPRCSTKCVVPDCGELRCLACSYEIATEQIPQEFPCLECSSVFRKEAEFFAHRNWHGEIQPRLLPV